VTPQALDPGVDCRYQEKAETEKYGNIQEFFVCERRCRDDRGKLGVRWQVLR